MSIRSACSPAPVPAARPKLSRISAAIRDSLMAATAAFALAGAHAAVAAETGPVEILQAGDIDFSNVDTVSGSADIAPYDVTAVLLHSYDGSTFAENTAGASITAAIQADAGYVLARGLVSYGADSFISNSGDIESLAEVELGNSVAIGVASFGVSFSTLYNEAEAGIHASAWSGQGVDYGPDANAIAVFVSGSSAYVVNDGEIGAQAQADGDWALAAATGVRTEGMFGFATLVNYGDISAQASTTSSADAKTYAFAYGADTQGHYGYYTASAVNYGDISATASVYRGGAISIGSRASAKYAYTANVAGGTISADSFVEYGGIAHATAVETSGIYYAHDVNAGDISAYASSHNLAHYGYFSYGAASATGVREVAEYFGGVVMENSGSITATAVTRDVAGFFFGGSAATGVYQNGKYYAGMDNSGDIHAQAYSELGIATSYGVVSRSKYGAYTVVENHEGASIVAVAETGSAADDTYGGRAFAHGINMFGGSFALVYNEGEISASAYVDPNDRDYIANPALAYAYGIEQRGSYGATLDNSGSINAFAGADFGYSFAYGAKVTGLYYAVAYNHGEIAAVADADHGEAFAVGLYLDAPGQSQYLGCGPEGCYYAFYGGLGAVINEGDISAHADAQDGRARAYGAVAITRLDGTFDNSGEIVATADAAEAEAVGVLVRSDYGFVTVSNSAGGLMGAAALGDDASATALWLLGAYGASLYNAGDIIAAGDGERIAISSRGGGGDVAIENQGLIEGSVLLGDGDDVFYNGSDGVLRLEDAVVDMGLAGEAGNQFDNAGLVSVQGDSHIDMGGGLELLVAGNPYAFYNSGVIDLQDGATDDRLTITGDFAGDGDIDVDISGADGSSDVLYIDGNVAGGTVATINIQLLDLPQDLHTLAPTVYVSGGSAAGNFVIGEVHWDEDDSFVSLDFGIATDLDASDATPDSFALAIEVTGLSDPGTLATTLAPSVSSLANAQVGNWRQRMGVVEGFSAHALALWARVFQDQGGISPGHHASNLGQGGNFDWHQRNSGVEAGINFALSDQISLGLLLAQSQADTDLEHGGHGSADIDADSWGLYGTWISPQGFYLDASYRWLDFDVDLSSVAGTLSTDGDAETFNLEAGYAWTLSGGLKLEPQLQYTRTSVDKLDVLVSGSGMAMRIDGGDSSRGRAGLALRKNFGEAGKGWSWTPYGSLSAVREFDGKSGYAVNGLFTGETRVDGTSALLELGFSAHHQGWSLYGGLNWQDGGAVDSFLGGQLGLRYRF